MRVVGAGRSMILFLLMALMTFPSAANVLTGYTLGTFYGGELVKDLVFASAGEESAYVELPFNAEVVSSTLNVEGLPFGGMWTTSGTDFDSGTYSDTEFVTDHVQLAGSGTYPPSGTYESMIFDAGYVTSWNSIEWWYGYGEEFPNWGASEVHSAHPADMTSNVLLMHFNETSPDTISGHDFQDTSGNGNHGDEVGGVAFGLPGVFNGAAGFDGIDDAVIVPDSPTLDLSSEMSVEAWLYLSGADTWTRKVPIYISPPTPENDFQIRIEIPYMDGMQDDFDDLRFLDSSGNQLPYWIEAYTPSTRATVWVRIPNAGTEVIYMYYGNPSASSLSDPSSVFIDMIPDLRVAYHFDEGSGSVARDTAYDWLLGTCSLYTSDFCDDSALINGASWTTGKFGGALEFDGVNDWINLDYNPISDPSGTNNNPTFDNYLTDRTVLVWIKPDDASTTRFVYEEGATVNGLDIYVYGDGNIYVGAWSESYPYYWAGAWLSHPVDVSEWQHVAYVFDGGNEFAMYYNGVKVAETTSVDNRIDGPHTGNDAIGAVYDGTKLHTGDDSSSLAYFFDGVIDEFLVFDAALNETQVREIYENYVYTSQSMPGTALIVKAPPSAVTVTLGTPSATGISKDGAYGLGASGNKIYGTISTSDGNFEVEYVLPSPPSGWNHVALTYDGSELKLYLNGTLVASTSASGAIVGTDDPLIIGDYIGFQGSVDELAIFSRALSDSEVRDHYARGVTHLILEVRSCDDPGCVGDAWVPVNYPPPQALSVPDNRYFQFRATFLTQDATLTPELYRVDVNYGTGAYPSNVYLDVGNDGNREWGFVGPLDHLETVDDTSSSPSVSSQLNKALVGCNCTGCVLSSDTCRIPLVFHSDTEGILRLSSLSISYNKLFINVSVTSHGEPLSGALVELIRPSGGDEVWTYGYTDSKGTVGFPVTRGWTYDVRVSKPGYGTVVSRGHLPGDDVNIELEVSQTTRTKYLYRYLTSTQTVTETETVYRTKTVRETVTVTETLETTPFLQVGAGPEKTITVTQTRLERKVGTILVDLSSTESSFPVGSKASFVMTLENRFSEGINGKLVAWFVDPEGNQVNRTALPLNLTPNEKRTLTLSLDLKDAKVGSWSLHVTVTLGNLTRNYDVRFRVYSQGGGWVLDPVSVGTGLLLGTVLLMPFILRKNNKNRKGNPWAR